MLDCETLIVGAGFSGLGLAMRLHNAGITDFRIVDAADGIGGVWHHNTYPGVAVDIPSTTYSYSFEPNPRWSQLFAPGSELKAYAEKCAAKYGLHGKIQLNTRVEAATYDPDSHCWRVQTTNGTLISRFLVSAVGPLDQPNFPSIPGLEDFDGPVVHTARWDPDLDLVGKKVGIIGTGASALQLIPEVAQIAQKLTVFQRTPIWVIPKPNTAISPRTQDLFARAPLAQRALRLYTDVLAEAVMTLGVAYHRRFPLFLRAVERVCLAHLKNQVHDPETRARLTPSYALGCKRPSFSSTYLPTFNRDNVELVTEAMESIEPTGVVTRADDESRPDQTRHPLDVLILATGFKTMQLGVVPPFPLHGVGGIEVGSWWDANGYRDYEGISTPLAPNFWLMSGPWSAAGPSWFSVIESGSRHIVRCITASHERRATEMRVKQAAHDAYMRAMHRKARGTAFTQPTCVDANSYYFDRRGEAPFVRPISGLGLLWASSMSNLGDYAYSTAHAAAPGSKAQVTR